VGTISMDPTEESLVLGQALRLLCRADEVVVVHQHNSPIYRGPQLLAHEVVVQPQKRPDHSPAPHTQLIHNPPLLMLTTILSAHPKIFV
jgi:hypothetical protein